MISIYSASVHEYPVNIFMQVAAKPAGRAGLAQAYPRLYGRMRQSTSFPASLAMRIVSLIVRICVTVCIAGFLPLQVRAAERACAKVIVSGDPNYPPFSWYDGHVMRGVAIDIAQRAFEHAGIPFEVRYVGPFNRVLQSARNGTVDLVAELKDTPERREYLAYSSVAIFSNPVAVFVRGDSKLAYREWKDLAGLHGGITLGNKFGGGFDEYLAQSLSVESANSIASNFAKLQLGRIDYFVNSYY